MGLPNPKKKSHSSGRKPTAALSTKLANSIEMGNRITARGRVPGRRPQHRSETFATLVLLPLSLTPVRKMIC